MPPRAALPNTSDRCGLANNKGAIIYCRNRGGEEKPVKTEPYRNESRRGGSGGDGPYSAEPCGPEQGEREGSDKRAAVRKPGGGAMGDPGADRLCSPIDPATTRHTYTPTYTSLKSRATTDPAFSSCYEIGDTLFQCVY